MISASHNPMPDNGIKLFSRGGHKLPDAVEAAIERTVVGRSAGGHRPTGAGVGRVRDLADGAERYARAPAATVDQPLTGVRVVVDCAHGAAADAAPRSTAGPAPTCTRSGASPTAGTSTTASAPPTSAR